VSSSPHLGGRRGLVLLPLIALGIAAAVLLTGCGQTVGYTKGNGDRSKGKELFTQNCGSCHTLADAGTSGQIGPNLDYAFVESRKNGLGESTILQVVRGQIAYPVQHPSTGAPGMPANIVEGQDADDVASYVAAVAGIGDIDHPKPQPTTSETTTTTGGGGGGAGDAAAGKQVFETAGCKGCHTLADAGATGTVGPNLDDAKPDEALVVQRVTNGMGAMPPFKGQLSDKQIQDVAAYVSSVAGK
jgi:mono/diheme cytochrome c family protein